MISGFSFLALRVLVTPGTTLLDELFSFVSHPFFRSAVSRYSTLGEISRHSAFTYNDHVYSTCARHLHDTSSRSIIVVSSTCTFGSSCCESLFILSPLLLLLVVVVVVAIADRHPPLCFSLSGQSERDAVGQGQSDHGSKITIISPFRPHSPPVHVVMYSSSLDVLIGHYPLPPAGCTEDRHTGPETV